MYQSFHPVLYDGPYVARDRLVCTCHSYFASFNIMYLVVIFDPLFAEVICYEDEYYKSVIPLSKVWARVHTGSLALKVNNNTSVKLHQTLLPALLTLLTHYINNSRFRNMIGRRAGGSWPGVVEVQCTVILKGLVRSF